MRSAVVVADLRKSYGPTKAVDGVSLDIPAGEFFGILGPNGAGKTTTLEIVEGLREPDSGTVTVLGVPPRPRTKALLRRVGVQIQAAAFFERLTAREQLHAFARLCRVPTAAADDMLELFGLTASAGTLTERLSGGQAQRLAIACALVHGPELVFLDEPTAGLDPQARRNLWDVLRELNTRDGRTIVLTTHYLDEAEVLCDRVAIMDAGRVLRTGSPAALIREMGAATRVSVDATALTAAELTAALPGESCVDDGESLTVTTHDPAKVLAELALLGALHGVSVRGATLEDVFLSLTGREYRA